MISIVIPSAKLVQFGLTEEGRVVLQVDGDLTVIIEDSNLCHLSIPKPTAENVFEETNLPPC